MNGNSKKDSRPIVVCIHGSASTGGQWRALRKALRGRCRVYTPDLVGYGSRKFRTGRRFQMQQEVDAVIEQIGDTTEPFHLIGHSYGGVVATYLASRYPERVKSLILYEPANFNVLFEEGLDSDAAKEILKVRAGFADGPGTAISRWRAARQFINYWSGAAAWRSHKFAQRTWFASMAPKIRAEFDAILGAHEALHDVSYLEMPVKIICGTQTRLAAKRVAELMAAQIPQARLLRLVGLQHMAPLTDPDTVNPLLIDFVAPVPLHNTLEIEGKAA